MWLDALSKSDMAWILYERNDLPPGILRTPHKLTLDQQMEWYYKEVCDRRSTTRYWALRDNEDRLVGYGGIENIQWENGMGEMSLMIFSKERRKGYGRDAVNLFLLEAFGEMGLDTVFAEVYECNPNMKFWEKQDFDQATYFPRRKRMGGKLYDSHIFIWTREEWI